MSVDLYLQMQVKSEFLQLLLKKNKLTDFIASS